MSFIEAVKACFSKYATFTGRARRSEFWYFNLFYSLIYFLLFITGIGIFILPIVGLAFILPLLSVGVRRLHDIGKSGWWILINLIPIIGWIIFLVWCCTDSQQGGNNWGANPKV